MARMRSVRVLGLALKMAREMAGYTQEQVADRLGIDRSNIAHWESEKRPDQPNAAHFKALVELYDVPRESLLVGRNDRAA